MKNDYQYKNLIFKETCSYCPEQYEVYEENEMVCYVRLRWGNLTATFPDVGGELIYNETFEDNFQGCFSDYEEKEFHLKKIGEKILNKLNEK